MVIWSVEPKVVRLNGRRNSALKEVDAERYKRVDEALRRELLDDLFAVLSARFDTSGPEFNPVYHDMRECIERYHNAYTEDVVDTLATAVDELSRESSELVAEIDRLKKEAASS